MTGDKKQNMPDMSSLTRRSEQLPLEARSHNCDGAARFRAAGGFNSPHPGHSRYSYYYLGTLHMHEEILHWKLEPRLRISS